MSRNKLIGNKNECFTALFMSVIVISIIETTSTHDTNCHYLGSCKPPARQEDGHESKDNTDEDQYDFGHMDGKLVAVVEEG